MLEEFKIIPVHYFDENKDTLRENGIKKIIHQKNHTRSGSYSPLFDYIPTDEGRIPNILTNKGDIDFIMAHVPPYGLLDKTRDYSTHREIKFTGNKFIRLIVDKRKPNFVFFGHNHFCNYKIFNQMVVISIDKFCRKIPAWADDNYLDFNYKKKRKNEANKARKKAYQRDRKEIQEEKNIFSYCLITKTDTVFKIEIYRKNVLVFQYDATKKKVIYSKL
jgi:Icc-related predicted phosphoesterase